MNCLKCGKDVGNAKFCPECGEKVIVVPDEQNTVEMGTLKDEKKPVDGTVRCSAQETAYAAAQGASEAPNEYYEAMQRIENEKASKKKKRRIGCLGVVLAVISIFVVVGIVRGNRMTQEEKQQILAVETAIESLPDEISLNDFEMIRETLEKYQALHEKQQKRVKNRKVLLKAEKTVDELRIEEVENAITLIGTVSENSGEKIENAYKLYEMLPEDLKANVSYDTLEKAKSDYKTYCIESVKKLIDGIGTVTLDSKEVLKAIADKYEQLSEENQSLVSNYSTYTAAAKQYEQLEKEQQKKEEQARKKAFQAAVKGFRHEVDEISDWSWYYPKAFPKHINQRSYFLPYLSVNKKTGEVNLRLKVDYFADDWIFWKELTISVDGNKSYMHFGYHDVDRDNHYGKIWEYVDISCNADDILLLRSIAYSKKTIVRFEGDMYREDMTVSENDKASIRSTLDAYDAYYGKNI